MKQAQITHPRRTGGGVTGQRQLGAQVEGVTIESATFECLEYGCRNRCVYQLKPNQGPFRCRLERVEFATDPSGNGVYHWAKPEVNQRRHRHHRLSRPRRRERQGGAAGRVCERGVLKIQQKKNTAPTTKIIQKFPDGKAGHASQLRAPIPVRTLTFASSPTARSREPWRGVRRRKGRFTQWLSRGDPYAITTRLSYIKVADGDDARESRRPLVKLAVLGRTTRNSHEIRNGLSSVKDNLSLDFAHTLEVLEAQNNTACANRRPSQYDSNRYSRPNHAKDAGKYDRGCVALAVVARPALTPSPGHKMITEAGCAHRARVPIIESVVRTHARCMVLPKTLFPYPHAQ